MNWSGMFLGFVALVPGLSTGTERQELVCRRLAIPTTAQPEAVETALAAAVEEYRLRGNDSISRQSAVALREALLAGVCPNDLGRRYSREAPLAVELRPALKSDGPVFERFGTFDEQLHIMFQLSRRALGLTESDPEQARRYARAAFAFAALFDDVELQTLLATAMKSEKVVAASQLTGEEVAALREVPRALLAARGGLVVNRVANRPWYKLYTALLGERPWDRAQLGEVLARLEQSWGDARTTAWENRDVCSKLRGLLVPLAARGDGEGVRAIIAKRDTLANGEADPMRKRFLEMVTEGVDIPSAATRPAGGR